MADIATVQLYGVPRTRGMLAIEGRRNAAKVRFNHFLEGIHSNP